MQREEWMSSEFDILKASERGPKKAEIQKREEEEKRQEILKERQVKTVDSKRSTSWGDKGSNWRMIKLKRVYEIAAEEKRPLDEVALDRYGSMEEFQDAVNERDYLDSRLDRSSQSNASSSSYRAPFRKSQFKAPESKRQEQMKKTADPIVAKVAQQAERQKTVKLVAKTPVLSVDELNKLSAKVIKAKLLKQSNVDKLEADLEFELERARTQKDVILIQDGSPKHKRARIETFPSRDKDDKLEEHDSSSKTLHDLLREEKLDSESHFDRDMAHQISKDSRFEDDLEYLDESTDNISRRKRKEGRKSKNSDRDKSRKEAEIDECQFCYHDGQSPNVSVVAVGIKAYLALPETIDMTPFHCFIVPMNHVTSTLELDDDVWDEIRNFKKCLIRMCESKNLGILFMEQVIDVREKRHTVIECIPVPRSMYEDAPAYFKEALTSIEGEWTQHKSVIITDKGFRKSMVKNLSYFHIWFDPNRGYGHVIEDSREWPVWFGKEVIASVLDLPPDKWRRPKLIEPKESVARVRAFVEVWKGFDWTSML